MSKPILLNFGKFQVEDSIILFSRALILGFDFIFVFFFIEMDQLYQNEKNHLLIKGAEKWLVKEPQL